MASNKLALQDILLQSLLFMAADIPKKSTTDVMLLSYTIYKALNSMKQLIDSVLE